MIWVQQELLYVVDHVRSLMQVKDVRLWHTHKSSYVFWNMLILLEYLDTLLSLR